MKAINLTKDVMKFDKFNEIKEEHSLNIEAIEVTKDVLKYDQSKVFSEEHL